MSSRQLPRKPMVAIAVLTLCAALVGLRSWPKPARTASGWQVAEVAGGLWTLLAVAATALLLITYAVSKRDAGLQLRDPITWVWGALILLSAGALAWNSLYLAALSATESGPVIPVFHWLFTFAPALLAGWLFSRRSWFARRAAALGTGVVTVPLLALGWSLLDSSGLSFAGVGRTLWTTALLGVVPLAGAVALVGAIGKRPVSGP